MPNAFLTTQPIQGNFQVTALNLGSVSVVLGNVLAAGSQLVRVSQDFLASGTFNVPAGVTEIIAEMCGGGGGGAGGAGGITVAGARNGSGGGAGGGGAPYSRFVVPVLTDTSFSVTIGPGGAGGTGGAIATSGNVGFIGGPSGLTGNVTGRTIGTPGSSGGERGRLNTDVTQQYCSPGGSVSFTIDTLGVPRNNDGPGSAPGTGGNGGRNPFVAQSGLATAGFNTGGVLAKLGARGGGIFSGGTHEAGGSGGGGGPGGSLIVNSVAGNGGNGGAGGGTTGGAGVAAVGAPLANSGSGGSGGGAGGNGSTTPGIGAAGVAGASGWVRLSYYVIA